MNSEDGIPGRKIADIIPLDDGLWQSHQLAQGLRMFWLPRGDDGGDGFDFYCLSWVAEYEEDQWEILFHGSALWDGVRHLYFGEGEDAGYLYYPDLAHLQLALSYLDKLEDGYCSTLR